MIDAATIDKVKAGLKAPRRMLIGDRWVEASDGSRLETLNPADGTVLTTFPNGGAEDIDRAVKAARAAFERGPWRDMTPAARARLIWKLGELIDANADELAVMETLDNGKPIAVSRNLDVPFAAERMRYNAGWATKLDGETIPTSLPFEAVAYTTYEPVGVVGHIIAWNAPLASAVAKLAPSLAAGCTMVLKPAEDTPLTALRLGELVEQAGFPAGVVNIVTGKGEVAGAALAAHPDVDKISFTGSTEVGKALVRAAAGNLKRLTLELGGKSPVIVLPDADLAKTIPAVANGIFFCTGQVCTAGSRLFAHGKVFDEVVAGVAEIARKMKLGPGLDPTTTMGPLVNAKQLQRVAGYIRSGQDEGAKVAVGGNTLDRPGYFVEPTILTDTRADMRVRREEIFGPVLCAQSFGDEELEALAAEANNTTYGLAANIFTTNLSAAHKLARRIRAGTVKINGGGLDQGLPAGGFKQSGWGREYGRDGVEIYTEKKSVIATL
jgi:phenylacetaldehyde dehydrogenase